jgi:hypothetical protein
LTIIKVKLQASEVLGYDRVTGDMLVLTYIVQAIGTESQYIPWVHLIETTVILHQKLQISLVLSGGRTSLSFVLNLKGLPLVQLLRGDTALFWSDLWDSEPLMSKFPRLHSFAIDKLASVKNILDLDDPIDAFHLPLSTQAFDEFQEFNHLLNQISSTRNANDKDLWSYSWGTHFSAKMFYKMHFEHIQVPLFFPWIWKSKCTLKIKSFFWLLANDHLNTNDMLMRRSFNLNDNGLCRMCDNGLIETRDHLFWSCTFSLQCWQFINIKLEDNMDLSQMIATARSDFGKPFFFRAFATAAWNIWKQRNAHIFDNVTPSVRSWSVSFKRDLYFLSYRMKGDLKSPLIAWLDYL